MYGTSTRTETLLRASVNDAITGQIKINKKLNRHALMTLQHIPNKIIRIKEDEVHKQVSAELIMDLIM